MFVRTDIAGRARRTSAVLWLAFLACLAATCFIATPRASAQTEDLLEVFWEFRYAGLVDGVIGSFYDGDHFYVSLADLFDVLHVDLDQDPRAGIAHGFYLESDRTYAIDFAHRLARVGSSEVALDSAAFVAGPLGFFLRPDAFHELFGLTVHLNERQLILTIESDEDMPILAAHRRRLSRTVRGNTTLLEAPFPLLYDRDRRFLYGGVLGYRLSSSLSNYDPRTTLNLRGGGELLGGDLEAGIDASYGALLPAGHRLQTEIDTWRWRYVGRDSPLLTQAAAGILTSDGLRSFSYDGLRISNEPVHLEEYYGTYPLHVDTRPGWEIEVYVNSALVDAGVADATGTYSVAIPITYGSTNVMVREYGPSGEFQETERRVQVPFTFVPRGAVRYNVFAGRGHFERRNLLQASAAAGITGWMTARAGLDYVTADTSRSGERLGRVAWGELSVRVRPPYILTLQAAPGARIGGAFNAFFPSLATYGIEFYRYGSNPVFNRQRALHETRLNALLPFHLGSLPVHFRANLYERKIAERQYAYNLSQELVVQPGAFRASMGFRAAGTVSDGHLGAALLRLEPRVGYAVARSPAVPALVRGTLVSVRSSMDLRDRRMLSLSTNLSRSVSRHLRFQADVGYQFRTGLATVTFRVMLNLARVRTTTSAYMASTGPATLTQDISGAISYDGGTGRLGMADQNWVGRSAATLRLFVDYDGNGRRGEDEPFIQNGGIRFRRSVTMRPSAEGHLVAHNLLPYEQYSVSVDQSQIRNPLWVPRIDEFSFVADPNVHKVIDIPFYVTGELTGSILHASVGGLRAVPGLKLHIREAEGRRSWTEAVFSDGTFYKIGLPPGRYEARVDSVQMSVLGVAADPPVRRFIIQATEFGDVVDGLDFVLRDAVAASPAEAPFDAQSGQEHPTADLPSGGAEAMPSEAAAAPR